MARVNQQLLAFNRGEVSRIALARVDVAKLALAAQCQVNWLPLVVGPMMLRPGLLHIGETAGDSPATLLDFVYAKTDTALLELTNLAMRVWINDALVARVSVGTTVSDPNFAGGGNWDTGGTTTGCTATIAGGVATLAAAALGGLARVKQTLTIAAGDQGKEHGLRVTVSNGPVTIRVGSAVGLSEYLAQTVIDTGTHSLPFTPTGGAASVQIESADTWAKTLTGVSIEAAGTLTLPTPWAAATLSSLRWTQSGDIVYVAQYGGQQYKIERRGTRPGARGWSVVRYRSNSGPFHAGADDPNVQLKPGALYGNTPITASLPFFQAGHVGALLRLFTPQQNNAAVIGAANQFTVPTRVTGLQGDRNLGVSVTGITGTGSTWSLQRSLIGPREGFVTIASGDGGWNGAAPNFTVDLAPINYSDDKTTAGGTIYDNVIAWYRIGIADGNYAGGAPTCTAAVPSGGGFGIARITAFGSSTSVSVEILEPFTGISSTALWQISDWCPAFGWPTSVAFQEGRLWWLSGSTNPIAASESDDYTGYAQQDRDGNSLGDAGAILESFGEGPSDSVNWLLSLQRLLCGREQSIASIRSSSLDTPLTPTNFAVKDCAQQGAARLPPLKFGKNGIYVQQNGNKVYELTLSNPYLSDYNDRDLTRLNLDIGKAGFLDTARAMQPDGLALLPRGDGQLACLLYDPNDEVEAWWRIMTLGTIERAHVLPNWAGGADDFIYLVVKRVINGVTRRFIEKLAQRRDCVGGAVNQQLDCAFVYSGAPLSSVNVPWLPNTPVQIWADGAYIGGVNSDAAGNVGMPDGKTHSNIVVGLGGAIQTLSSATLTGTFPVSTFALGPTEGYPAEVWADIGGTGRLNHLGAVVVTGGAVTLPNGAQALTCVLALGYAAPFESAKLAYGAQGGSALTQRKKIDHLGLVLYDTGSTALQFGQRMDVLDPLPLVEAGQVTPAGTVWSEYDAPPVEVPGEWSTDARLCLLAQAPNPCMVGGVVVAMATNER